MASFKFSQPNTAQMKKNNPHLRVVNGQLLVPPKPTPKATAPPAKTGLAGRGHGVGLKTAPKIAPKVVPKATAKASPPAAKATPPKKK